MKKISIANDIIPVGEFKAGISKWLKNIQKTRHPLIITQNGRPAGVLLSPKEYDNIIHTKLFIDSVTRGISDAESGKVYSTKELKSEIKNYRASRNKNEINLD